VHIDRHEVVYVHGLALFAASQTGLFPHALAPCRRGIAILDLFARLSTFPRICPILANGIARLYGAAKTVLCSASTYLLIARALPW
jgi:hypothetical protein